jgi:precorrin-2 dehydrogenase/sirohydrochlorin ferrochelatase/precorrin-6A/cobalt-precorrin-6A reductase
MTEMRFFPLFLDLSSKKVLVIGGGNIAGRRVKALLDFGAEVTVISPQVSEFIENHSVLGTITLLKASYQDGDITKHNPFLVVVATDQRQVNHAAMEEAKRLNLLVSVADCREECTFFFPAIAESETLVAGLVSKNGDHAYVRRMANDIRGLLNE